MEIIAFNRRWAMTPRWLLNSLLAFTLLAGLSLWQLQRAAEKTHLLEQLAKSEESGVYAADYVQTLPLTQADGRQVVGRGRWLSPQVWLVDNQVVKGRVGYDVLVPVQLDSVGQPMLVNLGWVAAPAGRERLPHVQIPAVIEVRGLLRTQLGGFRLGQNIEDNGSWPMRIQQVYVPALDRYVRSALYPGLIYQMEASPFLIHYQPVIISPERHRAYALQWGLLAFAVLVVSLAASSRPLEKIEGPSNPVELSDDELFRRARDSHNNATNNTSNNNTSNNTSEFNSRSVEGSPIIKH